MEEGLDPDEEDEETMRMLEEEESKSSGNILKDLQNRFDDEKDALLRRLRVSMKQMASRHQLFMPPTCPLFSSGQNYPVMQCGVFLYDFAAVQEITQ